MMQTAKKILPKDKIGMMNKERFHYDNMEEEKNHGRHVTYGDGSQ